MTGLSKTLTFNGNRYALSDLSAAAQETLARLQATEQHITTLKQRLSIHQTARASYANALQLALPNRVEVSVMPQEVLSRRPCLYWHALGTITQECLLQQVAQGTVTGKKMEEAALLERYHPGDHLIAYVKGVGAVGWAEVTTDSNLSGKFCVAWQAWVPRLSEAISPRQLREIFALRHPSQPSVKLDKDKGEALKTALVERMGSA